MTIRAIAGLVVLNVFIVGVGAGVLWALRGWRSWLELLRLTGVAYLLGTSSLIIVLTVELFVGIPFGLATLAASGAAVVLVGVVVGHARGRSLPGLRRGGWRVPVLSLPVAVLVALVAVYFEALFRASRLAPAGEVDAWWVWTIRAKALYFFGDLGGADLVRVPGYPPGLSLLHGGAFEAMGSTDAVTLHLQHWFLALGFVLALAGLLSGRVRPLILLPFILIGVAMPAFLAWATVLYADLLLTFQVAAAATLLYLWLEERSPWMLGGATILLGGALLTKREGVAVVACLLLACLVASARERGWAWPRLAAAGGCALAFSLPWWLGGARGSSDVAPSEGMFGLLESPERLLPTLELVAEVLLDLDNTLGLPVLAAAAVLAALAAGVRRQAVLASTFIGLSVLAVTALVASEPLLEFSRSPELNPVDRLVLVYLVVLIPLVALLFEEALRRSDRRQGDETSTSAPTHVPRWRVAFPWVVLLGLVIAYPASTLAGHSIPTLIAGP